MKLSATSARPLGILAASALMVSCAPAPEVTPVPTDEPPASVVASPAQATRTEGRGEDPVLVGEPIDLADLEGRIVFDDFEDVFTMNVDGTEWRTIAGLPGAEFDGAWSPDGRQVVYRDSRRGINEDDEIYIVDADGANPRNLTEHPANDWGPDWSPDGAWIAFNSDRDGVLAGYLVRPDGSDLRRIDVDGWFEYPSFSPDGTRIVFERPAGGDYDVFTVDLASGEVLQLTDAPGDDGWPVWSPDGSSIAFSTERDDCLIAAEDEDCWRSGEPGEHRSVWIMDADGGNQRRVTPEIGQFIAWSPDGRHLLVSGHTLFVVRPDGTGRVEIRPEGMDLPPGGIPDWHSESVTADECPPPSGDPAVDTVLEGFAEHDAVFIGEEHGSGAQHALFAQLLCDPRFPAAVDAIVVEWGNSRLQAIVDAYVGGGDVTDDELASVWRESTQGSVWERGVYRRFFELVRAVNAALPESERLRVLAGDPPIDRDSITATTDCDDRDPTCLDHWIFQRDESFAAATISVLDADQAALIILGAGHVTPDENLDAPPSVPELVEREHPGSTLVFIGRDLVSRSAAY
jgi:Tol biopolymer transport system component